jgi:hypothetical protein
MTKIQPEMGLERAGRIIHHVQWQHPLRLAAKSVLTGPWQGEQDGAATGGDAPDAVPKGQGEPQVAIGPGRDVHRIALGRGDGELGDGAHFGPGGSSAQAQQANTDKHGGEQCDQARPPSRDIHVAFALVSDGKRPTGNES